ncbi:M55 family metallopeptidase [Paracoccus aminophilus]|uniref:D-aminopeptidase n=1 Tax=Paracoccus aminophilus JCM 7686 TaxID=1367847 RepID=S5XUJ8_PARAH|nr:M55 family metallopeptidase [Paracoccus aminophilus]AGT11169.1 D-aminopeptidase [Paracoccus aminophilus JCM 7686]
MKVFISADMEGTAGIAHWDEADRNHVDYEQFRVLMTAEVVAACEGARAAGADEVLIKDAHESGRNLLVDRLPAYARIVRGWSGHPDSMMFGLDPSFDAAIYTGYHAKAGAESNPLAHTSTLRISRFLLNGEVASELTVNALAAARHGVRSAFIAGDAEICADAQAMIPGIHSFATLEGFGRASISVAPVRAQEAIRAGVEAALREGVGGLPQIEGPFEVVIEFVNPTDAYRVSWFPGARAHGPRAVAFAATEFFEIQRALRFLID